MAKTPWWCKLEFLEFSRHYIGMTDKQIVDDIRRSIESLCKENTKGNDFGSFLVRKALDRIESKAATASRENGKNGGRPRTLSGPMPLNVKGDAGHREAPDVSANVSNNTAVDAATRKDADERTRASNGGNLESGTSTANLSEAIAGIFPSSRNRREGSGSVLRGGCIEKGSSRIPATAEQLYDLADRLCVDRDDARQCWEATKERHGKTKDGKEIKDFPAYMVKWCKTTEAKRKSA